jgi:hypothetical protein
MRSESDSTQFNVKDLGDQPPGTYLVRFEVPSGHPMNAPRGYALWADEVIVTDENMVEVYRDVNPDDAAVPLTFIAMFPKEFSWYMVAASLVETMSVAECAEQERTNIADREAIRRDFERVQKQARGDD